MTAAVAAPLLAACEVRVELGGQPVLRGVDVEVYAGEIVGLLGPNGAGKSTFLRAATRVVPLKTGSIEVTGKPLAGLGRRELAQAVAVVQQLPEAPATMTVEELVLLGRNPHLGLLGRESAHDYAVVAEAMQRAGCEEFAARPLHTLSGGQRRRAFIARALAQEPKLLLLDEPTANLDVQAQAEAFELLRRLARDGVGVLVAVHDLTLAAAYCDRAVLLVDGRVIASGVPSEVVTPDIVTRVYGDRVMVIPHPQSGAPIVVPAVMEQPDA
jgi:iron complex transport system ATP-binding protein